MAFGTRRVGQARTALLLAGFSLGCVMRPGFTRPEPTAVPATIRGELSGKTYTDCKQAVAEESAANEVLVLTFSEGLFACGPELVLPDRALLRGAGLGRTFLEAGGGALTALRPGKLLRASDLAFGGTTPQTSLESQVELVRVAVQSSRGVLFGDKQGVSASVVVAHSVLSAWPGAVPEGANRPVPIANRGNDRVAVVESVLVDVEQEYERFPSPGSIVVVSAAVQAAFSEHQPAAVARNSVGGRPNLPCGGNAATRIACLSVDPGAPGDDDVSHAAQHWLDGQPLLEIEPHLRLLSKGFARRWVERLGPQVRQVEAFWFDETEARAIEQEGETTDPKFALQIVVRQRGHALSEQCGADDVPMRTALAPVRAFDRLLPTPELGPLCTQRLTPRLQAIVAKCETGFDWERTLAEVTDADAALELNGASLKACKDQLRTRLEAIAAQGPFALAYAHALEATLSLGASLLPRPTDLRFDALVSRLPYFLLRGGRATGTSTPATVRDRLLRRLQIPGVGDGRRIVETTPPCKLESGAAGQRATGRMQLTEEAAGGKPEDAKVGVEVEVSATLADIPPSTPDGAIALTLVKRCDELVPKRFEEAVDRYVVQELQRQVARAPYSEKAERDVAVLVVAGTEAPGLRWVPVSEKALRSLQLDLVRGLAPLAP